MSSVLIGSAYARALLSEIEPSAADIKMIAGELNLQICEVDAYGFDGALVRARELPLGAIVVRQSIPEGTRKAFTIAHELGHFLIPGHDEADRVCTLSDVGNWTDAAKKREREADEFAAELLMPDSIIRPMLEGIRPSLGVIEQIASRCRTSLSAAAWRYCDLTTEPCAVVWSAYGRIEWSKHSERFGFVLNRGAAIQPGTFAHGCAAGVRGPGQAKPVSAELWIASGHLLANVQVWEQSRALPNYDSVLSLLWMPEIKPGTGS